VSYGSDDFDGVITPDGNRVVWMSSRSGVYNLYWRNVDMSSPEEAIAPSPKNQFNAAVSPDGRYILYAQEGAVSDIWRYAVDTRKAEPLIATEHEEGSPAVSPDGRWLAYMSDRSGRGEIYVTSFPKPGGSWQASIDGGMTPRWMPDGKSIVYRRDLSLYIVPIETEPRPRAGKPVLLAEGPFSDDFSIARDGRIAAAKDGPQPTSAQFVAVMNWAEELKRRVPTR
ncbi:MAG TPA: hypothetical protein VEU30_06940, partial [Thermoanaerobaculia bacterium]|nr:hypothetical protein [Thermoanaerobaculia bacterium]